jgi:hypothetical protein
VSPTECCGNKTGVLNSTLFQVLLANNMNRSLLAQITKQQQKQEAFMQSWMSLVLEELHVLVMGVLYHIPWLTFRREKGVDISLTYISFVNNN